MIASLFPPFMGGAERQAQCLATRLMERGVDVCVLTRRFPGLKAYEEVEGVPVYRVLTLGRGGLAALSYILSSLLWLLKYGKKYQVIHCHRAESPAIIGIFAKLLYGKTVVVKISGGDLGLVNQVIRRKLLSAVNVFIALTDEMRAKLIRCGFPEAKIVIIPNGVDTNRYMPLSRKAKLSMTEKLGLPIDEKLIIFVGRLHPVKGLDTLLYAWQKISQSIGTNKARLLILGEGPQEPFLRQLVSQLGLEATILFLGRKGNVVQYLQCADVFALPSLSEGLPNALLEAMACGLAVVATDIAGNNEVVVHGKNGLLVPPRDPGTLARTLLTVLEDEELAEGLGEEARRAVEEGYSLEKVTDRYVKLYASLASDMENYIQKFKETGDKAYLKLYYSRAGYKQIYARMNPKWQREFAMISWVMNLQPGERVLDVGCASQMLKPYVEQAGAVYKGLDISEGFQPDYLCDAEDMCLVPDNAFHWVVFSDVLEHLPEPHKAIREAYRVGRKVIAVVPNWYELSCFSFLPHHPNDRHISCFPPREWLRLFEDAGFDVVHIRGFFYTPSVAFYPVRPLVLIDRLFRTAPFLWLSDLIDSRWADKPLVRFLGQELIIMGGKEGDATVG